MCHDNARIELVWAALRRALEREDWDVIEACRRLIQAERLGWRQFTTADDWNVVLSFDTETEDA